MQEIPAEILPILPVVGPLCKTFLAVEELVETAKSNKEALRVVHELCDLVIKGFLAPRKNHRWLPKEGFEALTEYVGRAKAVAVLCNKTGFKAFFRRFLLAHQICDDIASIRSDVLAFVMVNTLLLADGSHVSKPQSRLGNPACALLPPPHTRMWA